MKVIPGILRSSALFTVLLLVVSYSMLACTTYRPPKPRHEDIQALLARRDARATLAPRWVAEGRLRASQGVFFTDVRLLVVVEAPSRLRIEVLSPTDDLVAIATSNGSRLVVWERGASTCRVGPPCAEGLRQLIPIDWAPEDLVAALLGTPRSMEPEAIAFDEKRGHSVLRGRVDSQRYTASFAPATRLPARMSRRVDADDGSTRSGWAVEWSRWSDEDTGQPFPRRVAIEVPDEGIELVFRVEAGGADPVDSAAFEFECPPGVMELPLSCEP